MIPDKFVLDDLTSENKLNDFVEGLLGVEKFSPDSLRLENFFRPFKDKYIKEKVPIVIVAGTNGKGEVSLLLERYCLDNGLVPHVWNSPHILSVRERMSFNGMCPSAKELLRIFNEYAQLCENLSYYEFLFYIFCTLSTKKLDADPKVEHVIILEVGLGGRLDATNYFDSDMALLTSISRDHTEFLGNRLVNILDEKIAVTRPGKVLISAVEQDMLKGRIEDYCATEKVELRDLWAMGELFQGMTFHERNRSLAIEGMKYLWTKISKKSTVLKLKGNVDIWARPLRVTYKQCQFILLGSHNLDGLRHLAKWTNSLSKESAVKPISSELEEPYFDEAWISFSRQNKEDLSQCLSLVFESSCLGKEIYLTSFNHPRASNWNDLKQLSELFEYKSRKKVYLERDFNTLVQRLDSVDKKDSISSLSPKRVLFAGSYYFLANFLSKLPIGSYKFS